MLSESKREKRKATTVWIEDGNRQGVRCSRFNS